MFPYEITVVSGLFRSMRRNIYDYDGYVYENWIDASFTFDDKQTVVEYFMLDDADMIEHVLACLPE